MTLVRWGVSTHVLGERTGTIFLIKLGHGVKSPPWPDGMSADLAAFILAHCRCENCQRPIKGPFRRCVCRDDAPWGDLRAAYDREKHQDEVNRLLARELRRSKAAKRSQRSLQAGGVPITATQKRELLEAQAGLCYYCGTLLHDASGRLRAHCDHYIPLIQEGPGTLENSVMACIRCNLLKGGDDGHSFINKARRLKLVADPKQLASMRRAFSRWRRARGLRLLAELDPFWN